ncbi:ABC transporter permease [Streptococcus anginosus]|uniref:Oligopeptide transport system permease protein AmiC n=1 Tax=Streptococcus anginosus TaxID=1328 RepID=A0A448AKQ2_STRAP|nr:ABC transporter permease [Streptococcus anginosus]GAD39901.1 ABC-type dipeptide/oligopeptide/nickel transport systems, permease components [Streptococcus intermedius SK54 = ATCC 27335]EGL46229.1 ABC transporter, permease protein [Streptococcus anginosus SK52 = DSM 20563]MBZ2157791.1 ABC transporter permease [Streptococcus anginosus]ORE82585.1 peptide ABC transporter permease [Streptococcus anginosus SK52 = DSM 20563]UEB02014.1 ABC transporter permease [Streptococcus anginosus subsp. anginos
MKKYIFMRILRSLVSIFMVTTLTYTIIYTMVPRKLIFKQDPNYNKIATTPDKKTNYENTIFERMGYIDYYDTKELQEKASKENSSVTVEPTNANKKIYEAYIKKLGRGWKLQQFKESKQFYATREVPVYERVLGFYGNLIQIDHTGAVKDASNPNLKRYIRIENDPAIGWSVVGSGTKHKYLLYFNSQFPFIHQNFVRLNLGTSYPTYANLPVLQVISQGQGQTKTSEFQFPTGKKTSSVNIYTRTYKSPKQADARDVANYGKDDPYTATESNYQYPSMIVSSSIVGLIGLALSYLIAVPLGSYMARFKNTLFDSISTGALTFLMSLPTIALVYIIRLIGSAIGLPDSFPILGAGDWRSYVLPAVILGLLSAPWTAVWIRRYMIDLQSQDFVRFARAKGLSEKEISNKHIFKNAMVPLVSSIPGAIIGVITGATLTETIFAFPGMGKMLIDSVKASNNSMVVGLVFIFTCLSIFALLLGDILMTMLDPRIKLTSKGGK